MLCEIEGAVYREDFPLFSAQTFPVISCVFSRRTPSAGGHHYLSADRVIVFLNRPAVCLWIDWQTRRTAS